MPRCLQAMLSLLPALITGPFIFGTRDSWVLCGIHVLSSQTESMHCAQHSPTSWNKVCFMDTARFKRVQQLDRGLCLSPFCGQALQRSQQERREPPRALRTQKMRVKGLLTKTLQTRMYLMLRKILPVSFLSLLTISLFAHHHPVSGVSVPGAKHSSCRTAGLGADGLFYCNAEASETAGRSSWDHIFFLLNWGHHSRVVLQPHPLPNPGRCERMNGSGLESDLLQEGCLLEQAVLPALSLL